MNLKQLTAPLVLKKIPKGLMKDPRLTFDEFILYDAFVDVDKLESKDKEVIQCTIRQAALSMHSAPHERMGAASFTFSISNDDDLNQAFGLPHDIEESDLYSKFWPNRQVSNFLRQRSKLFHCYQIGYHSNPQTTYAGMTEWLQLVSGKLELTLIKPTVLNSTRFYSWDHQEPYRHEIGSATKLIIEPGQFILIPAGWIVIRKAHLDSYALGGEFLHIYNFTKQIEYLERDVLSYDGRYSCDRDSEIRALYWFAAARLMSEAGKELISQIDYWNLDSFKQALCEWNRLGKITKVPHNLYVPEGLQTHFILKDLVKEVSRRYCKSIRLKNPAESVNVLMDQTSTYNQTN